MDETTPVAEKLRIAPNQRVLLIAAPPDVAARLGALPPGVVLESRGSGVYDVVLLFTEQRQELEAEAHWVVQAVRPGGLLWICYPKLTAGTPSDLKREVVWDAVAPTGWRPVAQIAIDETWSALRFMPAAPGTLTARPVGKPAKRRKAAVRGPRPAAVRKQKAKATTRKPAARKAAPSGRKPTARKAAPSGRKPTARKATPSRRKPTARKPTAKPRGAPRQGRKR